MNKLALILAVTLLAPVAYSAGPGGQRGKVEAPKPGASGRATDVDAAAIRERTRTGGVRANDGKSEIDSIFQRAEIKAKYSAETLDAVRAVKNEALAKLLAQAIAMEASKSSLSKGEKTTKANIENAVKLHAALGSKGGEFLQILQDAVVKIDTQGLSMREAYIESNAEYRVDSKRQFEKSKEEALAEIKRIEEANKEPCI